MRFLTCCPFASAVNTKHTKSMTLPLSGGTSSPLLLVPSTNNSADNLNQKLNTTVCTQTLQRNFASTPKSEEISNVSSEQNRVGQSVFYDCNDGSSANAAKSLTALQQNDEKQDRMKPEKNTNDTDEEISEIDQGCTIFSGVTYLGAANINAPKSELDVYRIMSELNGGSTQAGLKISISIPNSSDGLVV